MSVPENFVALEGRWQGTNRLYTPWIKENPVHESTSRATVDFAARDKFLKFEYDWLYENQRQEGSLLVSQEKKTGTFAAIWIDSWHNGDKFMNLSGQAENNGFNLLGSYQVPDHPDWGWRVTLKPNANGSFQITMFNITPDGEEMIAVEMIFQKG